MTDLFCCLVHSLCVTCVIMLFMNKIFDSVSYIQLLIN